MKTFGTVSMSKAERSGTVLAMFGQLCHGLYIYIIRILRIWRTFFDFLNVDTSFLNVAFLLVTF